MNPAPPAPRTRPTAAAGLSSAFVLSLVLAAVLASCVTTDPRTAADFGIKGLADGDESLGFVALIAEYISDPYARAFTYVRLADEYRKRRQDTQAERVLRRAERVARGESVRPRKYQILTEIARLHVLSARHDQAKALLAEALDQIELIADDHERGQAVSTLVMVCFESPLALAETLRRAADAVYTLYDPEYRVQLLSDLGRNYHRLDAGNRATVFIQQSLAAASGIENVWTRSLAYARIASRLIEEDRAEEGIRYYNTSTAAIAGLDFISLGQQDQEALLELVLTLADGKRFSDAGNLLNRIPELALRLSAGIAVTERYLKSGDVLPARLLAQRMANLMSQQGADLGDEAVLNGLIRLAEIHAESQQNTDAQRYYQAAAAALPDSGVPDARARLALVAARLGLGEDAIALARQIDDPWQASQTLQKLGSVLVRPELYGEAETKARASDYLQDSALADLAAAWWRSGAPGEALRLLAGVGDPYVLAGALLDATAISDGGSAPPLNQDAEARLRSLVAAWYQKRP